MIAPWESKHVVMLYFNPMSLSWHDSVEMSYFNWLLCLTGIKDMEEVIKYEDEKFASIRKDDQKLRGNYVIAIGTRYVSTKTLLVEGQDFFFFCGKCQLWREQQFGQQRGWKRWTGERGAELYWIFGIVSQRIDSDTDQ
jgi:hypothetical protein